MRQLELPLKKIKIVCTIGPASDSPEVLERLIRNGMNVARLNFAHGDLDAHRCVIANIRAAAAAVGRRVAIMGDLPGPKMRIGRLADECIELERDHRIVLRTDDIEGDCHRLSVSFRELTNVVAPGDTIYLNDGYIQLEVERVKNVAVHCVVRVGGELRAFKGVNLPGIDLGSSAFTVADQAFLRFAAEERLDAVSQSFVQNAADVEVVRQAAAALGYDPLIIAKVERARAVDELDAILAAADGMMVARGDLGVEIPLEEVALVQKRMIRLANRLGKPVITATHMLESMIDNRRPTRAEVTDVANAILDGTDCVMLSGETAIGRYPDEAVAVMARIARVTEPQCDARELLRHIEADRAADALATQDLISLSIYRTVEALRPAAIVTPTMSGATPRRISRFRVPMWIVAVSPSEATCQRLAFTYGVIAIHEAARPASWEGYAYDWVQAHGVPGDLALLTHGSATFHAGGTNEIRLVDLEQRPTGRSIW